MSGQRKRVLAIASFVLLGLGILPSASTNAQPEKKKYKDENGVHVYGKEKVPLPKDAPKSDFAVFSQYGFRLIELDEKKIWAAATEEHFRKAEGKRLKIKPEEVKIQSACGMTSLNVCSTGPCFTATSACTLMFEPPSGMHPHGYYYCACY